MRVDTTVAGLQKALSGSAPDEDVARLLGAELTAGTPPTLGVGLVMLFAPILVGGML